MAREEVVQTSSGTNPFATPLEDSLPVDYNHLHGGYNVGAMTGLSLLIAGISYDITQNLPVSHYLEHNHLVMIIPAGLTSIFICAVGGTIIADMYQKNIKKHMS